jgi:hypothetical protein
MVHSLMPEHLAIGIGTCFNQARVIISPARHIDALILDRAAM